MKSWVKRLRGVLGIGTLWGGVGLAVGTLGGLIAAAFGGVPLAAALFEWGLGAAGAGLILGTGFAAVLTLLEGRRMLQELSPKRVAVWGALAGVGLPIAWIGVAAVSGGLPLPIEQIAPVLLAAGVSYGLLGAGLAAGTVSLAKKAPVELESGEPATELPSASGMVTGG